jgi:hypothetical protein
MQNPLIFEDNYELIKAEVYKKQRQWNLAARPDLDFDDFAMTCISHISNKWSMFDTKRGKLQHWISRIIQSQWINYLRNNYFTLTKPCAGCCFAIGNDECSYTKSGSQGVECKLYRKWYNSKKKDKHSIGMPLSIEAGHQQQVYDMPDERIDWPNQIAKLSVRMKAKLKPKEYEVYVMLYLEHLSEAIVEKKLKLKKDRHHSCNKFLKNIQKKIIETARQILIVEGL